MAGTRRPPGRNAAPKGRLVEGAPAASLLYLYGIIEPGTPATRLLESGRVAGIDPDEPLFAIDGGDLVGAASRVSATTFSETALNELSLDLPRLTPVVVRHEQAVRELFDAGPAIVPTTFGAVYAEEASITRFLESERPRLLDLLDSIRGKQEWGVKVFADGAAVRAAVETSSKALRATDEEARAAGPGRAYLLQRKREELLGEEVRACVGDVLESVIQELVSRSNDARLDDVPVNQDGPVELVLKAAFLVEEARAEAFKACSVELYDRASSRGLTLEVSGPWAPYSFTGARP